MGYNYRDDLDMGGSKASQQLAGLPITEEEEQATNNRRHQKMEGQHLALTPAQRHEHLLHQEMQHHHSHHHHSSHHHHATLTMGEKAAFLRTHLHHKNIGVS